MTNPKGNIIDMIVSFNEFAQLDIRIGTVTSVEKVPDADKLLRFMFDVSESDNRQIMAGMASFFPNPRELVDSSRCC